MKPGFDVDVSVALCDVSVAVSVSVMGDYGWSMDCITPGNEKFREHV